jgi:hypothetical protein
MAPPVGQHHREEAAFIWSLWQPLWVRRAKVCGPGRASRWGQHPSGMRLGAQEGPEHWDSTQEEAAAAEATAGVITGEDGLRGLIQGLV